MAAPPGRGRGDERGDVAADQIVRLGVPDRPLQRIVSENHSAGRPGFSGPLKCGMNVRCRQLPERLPTDLREHRLENMPVHDHGPGRPAAEALGEPVGDGLLHRVPGLRLDADVQLLVQRLEPVLHVTLRPARDLPPPAHAIWAITERYNAHPAAPLLAPVDAVLGPAAPLNHTARLARRDRERQVASGEWPTAWPTGHAQRSLPKRPKMPLTWGGAMGIRTPDLLHAMQALYQLSYSPATRSGLPSHRSQRHASVQETGAHPPRCGSGPEPRRQPVQHHGKLVHHPEPQSSSPSSTTSIGSGSAPTLNSSSRQRSPPTRRDSRDQQQLPIPPVTRSSKPSNRDIP